MWAMEERWTAEQVLGLAPDAASRKAGGALADPCAWPELGCGATPGGVGVVWGVCVEDGRVTHRTVVEPAGPVHRCSCAGHHTSPCAHALGLLLLWAGGKVPGAPPPDWAGRPRVPGRRVADPDAARRRAGRREAQVAAGAEALRRWLTDRITHGLAGTDREGYGMWDGIAERMVDAKAPGLASRLRAAAAIPAAKGAAWPGRLLEEYAELWLLLRAHEHRDDLDPALAAGVRARIGWTVAGGEVLRAAREAGTVARDRWLVLGFRDTAEGNLTERRMWLRGERTGRFALVLSFGAPGRSPRPLLPPGRVIEADAAFHEAATPLRAVLGEELTPLGEGGEPGGVDPQEAARAYGEALRGEPWLDLWPVVLSGVTAVPEPLGWRITGADGFWLPVDRGRIGDDSLWRLAALSGGVGLTVFGEYGPRGFAPVTAWHEGRAIRL